MCDYLETCRHLALKHIDNEGWALWKRQIEWVNKSTNKPHVIWNNPGMKQSSDMLGKREERGNELLGNKWLSV